MPGSPPIRTSVPGTMPPPSTRSNSVTPEGMRTSSCGSISVKGTAETSRSLKLLRPPARRVGCDFSSTREFHSPHSGHLPSHLPVECPQFWQTKTVSFFIRKILPQRRKGAKRIKVFFASFAPLRETFTTTLSHFPLVVPAPPDHHAPRSAAESSHDGPPSLQSTHCR